MTREELIDLADTYVSKYVANAEHYEEWDALIHETGIDENELKSILINHRLASDADVEAMSEEQLDSYRNNYIGFIFQILV